MQHLDKLLLQELKLGNRAMEVGCCAPMAEMPLLARRVPSERQRQVHALRGELASLRLQLRRVQASKDHELLYRDSVQEEQEAEILQLREQLCQTQSMNWFLKRYRIELRN